MNKEIIIFGDIEIEKRKSQNQKYPTLMDSVDIDKIIVSNNVSCKKSYEYFLGYKDDENIIPLCIMLTQMSEILMKLNVCLFW